MRQADTKQQHRQAQLEADVSLAATIFLAAWCRVVRRAGAQWTRIPLLNRIQLPGWVQSKVDSKIDEALDAIEAGR